MSNVLLLTAEEKAVFEGLPEALREGWKVEPETLTSFETTKQLQMRFHMSSLHKYPAFASLAKKIAAGEKLDPKEFFAPFDESVLPEVFFLIGARGLTSLIQNVLKQATKDTDLVAISAWSSVRHDLFETNASVS